MAATGQLLSVEVAPDGAFVPIGELDLATLQELRVSVDDVVRAGRPIRLDLAQLTFIESSVIHWFVEICDATGHPVELRNVSPTIRRILDLTASIGMDGDAWVIASS